MTPQSVTDETHNDFWLSTLSFCWISLDDETESTAVQVVIERITMVFFGNNSTASEVIGKIMHP